MTAPTQPERQHRLLRRYLLLSLAAALVTMALKVVAAGVTGSVGFLSDALESGVNLVAALVGLLALRVAARPPDASHAFGHGKAEYLSALVEGLMILAAAISIGCAAVDRLFSPAPLVRPGLGLALSSLAGLVNLAVGLGLLRAGRRHRSLTLVADGQHLLTDVWTSAGVIVGVLLVALTGWVWLDPAVALAVGLNILLTGYRLLRRSLSGLLSATLPPAEREAVEAVLGRYRAEEVGFAPVRTMEFGRQRYVYAVITVPGEWSVRRAHDVADRIEADVAAALPGTETFIHVQPRPG